MNSENPIKEPTKTKGSNPPSDEHSSRTPSPISPAITVSQSPPSRNEHGESPKKHRDWVDYTTIGLEVFGLVVLIAYTTFAALQWRATNRAANAAKSAADTAAQQTALMKQQLVGTQAALITVDQFFGADADRPSTAHLTITVRNDGHIPAHDVHFAFSITKREIEQSIIGNSLHEDISQYSLQTDHPIQRTYSLPLSGHDWEAVKNTRFTIRVEGTLFYENGFGDKVGQSFCQSFVNDSFTVRGTTYGGAAFYPW